MRSSRFVRSDRSDPSDPSDPYDRTAPLAESGQLAPVSGTAADPAASRRRQLLRGGAGLAALGTGLVIGRNAQAQAPRSANPDATSAPLRATPVVTGLAQPWAFEFLPDGRILVTERGGPMRLIADGRAGAPLGGVPAVLARGQGGLLDVALAPDFARSQQIFFSYAETGHGGGGTAVARARLGDSALTEVEVIWRQAPKVDGFNHWGSRIVFRPDGTMWVTLGDRYGAKDLAQQLDNSIGKIIRIRTDGSAPPDNPFVGKAGALPEIWSLGHRNIQAATIDPSDGSLWTVMHGARGGDELDRPEAGKNYGWPIITYGTDYSGLKIGIGTEREGLEQPVYYWDPVIAPSGATFYTGDRFPDWKGELIVGSLRGGIVRLQLRDRKVVREVRHLPEVGRVRDVKQGPDGLLYVAIDSGSAPILRIEPQA